MRNEYWREVLVDLSPTPVDENDEELSDISFNLSASELDTISKKQDSTSSISVAMKPNSGTNFKWDKGPSGPWNKILDRP